MKKAILYLNQFFGQIGGEDKADFAPVIKEGIVGPAMALQAQLGDDVKVTHTVICGDNYMGSHTTEATDTIMKFLADKEFDIFFAGPAFRAGRYGVACGQVCNAVSKTYKVPVITSMNEENPGVEMFRQDMYIFKGGDSAAKMRRDVKKMAQFGMKLLTGKELLSAEEEGYYGRGIRRQVWTNPPVTAADRAVDMLLKKLSGQPFETELPIPPKDVVDVAPSIKDLSKANIAIVTSGGIVPADNPDKIQSASATRWGKYDISGLDRLESGAYKTIHAGFDPTEANKNPNVIVPVDAMRAYEREGKIGKFNDHFYSTVGTGTTQGEAARMAKEMVPYLEEEGVDGVIQVST
jgi:glycine reductase